MEGGAEDMSGQPKDKTVSRATQRIRKANLAQDIYYGRFLKGVGKQEAITKVSPSGSSFKRKTP
jgi:hypothetical protein